MTRRILPLALSLLLAACSAPPSGSQGGPAPTPDPKPTATPKPPDPAPVTENDPYVWTVAGNGTAGFLDHADARAGMLKEPTDAVVIRGDTVIADALNHRIRRLTHDGKLQTLVGTGTRGENGDGPDGQKIMLDMPFKVTADEATGNIFFSELGNHLIRIIDISGRVMTIAGGGDYLPDVGTSLRGVYVQLAEPAGLAFDSRGELYVAERGGHRILRINKDWMVTVVAGTGFPGDWGDGLQALDAAFSHPTDVALDDFDNLYVADTGNHRIRKIGADGQVSTVAGTGIPGDSGEGGPGTEAQLNAPTGVAVDAFGNVYIVDSGNHRIRQLRPDGTLVTLAGQPFGGYGGEGELPAVARFNIPFGVSVSPSGTLLVADRDNHRLREFMLP